MDAVQRGQALQKLREPTGLTQAAVGAEFGVTKQAVAEWESGKSRPDVHKLRKLDRLYAAGGQVLALFDLHDDEVSSLRAELEEERAARRSEVGELRDQVEELIHQFGAMTTAVDELRQQLGAAQSNPRAATE